MSNSDRMLLDRVKTCLLLNHLSSKESFDQQVLVTLVQRQGTKQVSDYRINLRDISGILAIQRNLSAGLSIQPDLSTNIHFATTIAKLIYTLQWFYSELCIPNDND